MRSNTPHWARSPTATRDYAAEHPTSNTRSTSPTSSPPPSIGSRTWPTASSQEVSTTRGTVGFPRYVHRDLDRSDETGYTPQHPLRVPISNQGRIASNEIDRDRTVDDNSQQSSLSEGDTSHVSGSSQSISEADENEDELMEEDEYQGVGSRRTVTPGETSQDQNGECFHGPCRSRCESLLIRVCQAFLSVRVTLDRAWQSQRSSRYVKSAPGPTPWTMARS